MLAHATPFGQVGSFALLIDRDLPAIRQRPELVRIFRRPPDCDEMAAVSFPLRERTGGTKVVLTADLIDATPLTRAEAVELADLQRHLFGRGVTPRLADQFARKDVLRNRAVWAPVFDRLMRQADLAVAA